MPKYEQTDTVVHINDEFPDIYAIMYNILIPSG